jgi:uncharacterized damage-inducible protein DinB
VHSYEYDWVRQTRGTLLEFCESLDQNDFTCQNNFGWQSVQHTLVHIADCYYAWIGSFVLLKTRKPITPKDEVVKFNLNEIKTRFEHVDNFVHELLNHHPIEEPIQRKIPWRESPEILTITPGKLLMHTITHEFHHKGQIVAMMRQMGYQPPNTDILGTDD